jgi:hypothetical protein
MTPQECDSFIERLEVLKNDYEEIGVQARSLLLRVKEGNIDFGNIIMSSEERAFWVRLKTERFSDFVWDIRKEE